MFKALKVAYPWTRYQANCCGNALDRKQSNQRLSLSYCFELQPYMKVSRMISPIVEKKFFHGVHKLVYWRYLVEENDIEQKRAALLNHG